jgi:HAD superfamily hydrolase (TIGR01509 family)
MKQLEAIIFDVDGTLADTEDVHRRAFNQAFKEFELDWNWTPTLYEELLAISGGRERITYYGADLVEQFGNQDKFAHYVRDIHEVKTRIYAEMLNDGEIPLRPGVERLLGEIRDSGLTLAIATSSTFSNLKTLLDRNLPEKWMSWFAAIASCDTVSKKKPSPAVYNSVLSILKLDPSHAVAIEDTVNGCLAATNAGLATVITTHFFTRHHYFPKADLVVDSLGESDRPFKLIDGDAGAATLVDVALLEHLVAQRNELESAELEAGVRIATA